MSPPQDILCFCEDCGSPNKVTGQEILQSKNGLITFRCSECNYLNSIRQKGKNIERVAPEQGDK